MTEVWQQGNLVEVEITDLSDRGDGVGRWEDRAVFVPDTVSGDRAIVRLLHVKPSYAYAQLQQLLQPSPHRQRPHCIVADKCGGCQWQHIDDNYQRKAKSEQIRTSLERIGRFTDLPLAPILTAGGSLGYRNKASYPLARSATGQVQAGYYRKSSHQLINLNQCPVQDVRLNPLLAEIKQDLQERGWSIYDEKKHRGKLRHLSLRIGHHTGEILLTLVSTSTIPGLEEQAQIWLERYPNLVGVTLNLNPDRTNAILGPENHCLAGRAYLREEFAGLEWQLGPDTFFQVNTEAAEALLGVIRDRLSLQGNELLVDTYCGIGTFTLPLAQNVQTAIGIEQQESAAKLAGINANINGIANVQFITSKVETGLSQLDTIPDLVLLDPPRKGCDRPVLETLLTLNPSRLVYISCKPATLARDLQILCQGGLYSLTHLQPADFFPQTAHVECVAFLQSTS